MLSDEAVLVRMIRATPERVFDTCTKAELLALWVGPKPFVAAHVEVDLKVGGSYLLQLHGDDGMYTASGSYVELTPPHRIVMTWTWLETPDLPVGSAPSPSSLVTFHIQAVPDGSMLTLTHEGLPGDEAVNGYGRVGLRHSTSSSRCSCQPIPKKRPVRTPVATRFRKSKRQRIKVQGEALCALAEQLSEDELDQPIATLLVDQPVSLRDLIRGVADDHLPRHTQQLHALHTHDPVPAAS